MDNDRLTQLESLLREGSLIQRKVALDELAQCSAEQAVPIFQRLSTDPDFLNRRFAVMGLGGHRTPESLQILTDLLERESDDNVQAEIANSLFEFGPASIPLLQKLFKRNRHWLTRQTVISILMEANRDEVLLAVIREALTDQTQTVRETAILALGQLLKGDFHDDSLTILADLATAPFWRDRWRAATALTLSPHPRSKQILAKLQQDDNHYVVAAALEAGLSES